MTHEGVQLAVLGHAQGQGALAPAVTDDQGSHAGSLERAGKVQRRRPRPMAGVVAARRLRWHAALSNSPAYASV